jgi:cyclohexyl-isocyanide hydratase
MRESAENSPRFGDSKMQTPCGMILFAGMTQLDLTGPYEVLSRTPGVRVVLLGASRDAVRTEHGLMLTPELSFAESPGLDVLVVPGGWGVNDVLLDGRYLDFVSGAGSRARWVTSVCTGALLLGAAGLLRGYRATTHWGSVQFLAEFGAIPVSDERVVVDRNRITAAGVSAGIDFALLLASKLCDVPSAQQIQLGIEYDPAPPFPGGHPSSSSPEVVLAEERRMSAAMLKRAEIVRMAAQRMNAVG